ncbi:MAG: hypothetical protein V2I97_06285, partial [Desulfococcaceae bacterium]|nr:hypothetical protein [Desulfococcaceae bacterium]
IPIRPFRAFLNLPALKLRLGTHTRKLLPAEGSEVSKTLVPRHEPGNQRQRHSPNRKYFKLAPKLRFNVIKLRRRHSWKALKGRYIIAQGNALGTLN